VYRQLTTLQAELQPTFEAARGYPKASDAERQDVFRKLWNFRVTAQRIQQAAHADDINPDVTAAADSTWQALDELISSLNDLDVLQVKGTGDGVFLLSAHAAQDHANAFATAYATENQSMEAYAAAYAADHGTPPA
jgi:hypothetical protein